MLNSKPCPDFGHLLRPRSVSSGAAAPNYFCALGCLPFARDHGRAYSSNQRRDHLKSHA